MAIKMQDLCPAVGPTRLLLWAIGRETNRCEGRRPAALLLHPALFRKLADDRLNRHLIKWKIGDDPTLLDIPIKLSYGFEYPTVGAADGKMVLV